MTLALQHAIYSAILNTEAMATFMFLPASANLMVTNSYPKLLNAYPHLAASLGLFRKHTWDFRIIAVWETAARVYLNNQNPTWLRGLAKNIPEAKWFVKNVRNDPIHNARHGVMPGIGKCEKLPLDKKQIAKVPKKPAVDITAPVPCQSNPNLQLEVADWKSWAYTDGSC
eukprot:1148689-Pelagomonas_calceolata.AAC.2